MNDLSILGETFEDQVDAASLYFKAVLIALSEDFDEGATIMTFSLDGIKSDILFVKTKTKHGWNTTIKSVENPKLTIVIKET